MRRREVLATAAGAVFVGPAAGTRASVDPLRWLALGDIGGLAMVDASATDAAAAADGVGTAGLWLLDTGAEVAAVDRTLAARLRLRRRGTRRVRTAGGDVSSAALVEAPALQAGSTALDLQDTVVLDLAAHAAAAGEPVLGIVGWPTLGALDCRLDMAAGQWRTGATAVQRDPGAIELPRSADHALPVVWARLGERAPTLLLLDTGFAGALMLWGDAASDLAGAASSDARIAVDGIGGRTTVSALLLARLGVGAAAWLDVPTLLLAAPPATAGAALRGVTGAIGMALVGDAVLGFDARRRSAWTTAGTAADALPGGFGVVLAMRGGWLIAHQVLASSPAAAAGVRPGDRLVALDNAPLSQQTLPAAWGVLAGVPQARFVWQRDGAQRSTLLTRDRFFRRVV